MSYREMFASIKFLFLKNSIIFYNQKLINIIRFNEYLMNIKNFEDYINNKIVEIVEKFK